MGVRCGMALAAATELTLSLDMEREMSISEAKANFAAMIAAVQRGETVIITRRGKIAAEIRRPRAKSA